MDPLAACRRNRRRSSVMVDICLFTPILPRRMLDNRLKALKFTHSIGYKSKVWISPTGC